MRGYYDDLDEIEMEMGKERTMLRCDHAEKCSNGRCWCREKHYHTISCPNSPRECVMIGRAVKCIPVEPERVWWCPDCEMDSPFQAWHVCEHYRNGMWMQHKPAPSPGLLQRMGMAWWDQKGWFVVRIGPLGGVTVVFASATEWEAKDWLARDINYRAFRVSDGVQG